MALHTPIALRKISSVNPATGEVLREWACAGDSEVLAAVERARVAQHAWRELGVRKRITLLRDFQHRLHERKLQIAQAVTREEGKPVANQLGRLPGTIVRSQPGPS